MNTKVVTFVDLLVAFEISAADYYIHPTEENLDIFSKAKELLIAHYLEVESCSTP